MAKPEGPNRKLRLEVAGSETFVPRLDNGSDLSLRFTHARRGLPERAFSAPLAATTG